MFGPMGSTDFLKAETTSWQHNLQLMVVRFFAQANNLSEVKINSQLERVGLKQAI